MLLPMAPAALVRAVEGFEDKPEGEVRLTAPPGVVDGFLVPALPRLFAKHPGLRLVLDSSTAYADLTRREADLALRAQRPTSGDLVSVRVAEEPDVLVASRARAEAWGTLGSLEGIPFINYAAGLAHIPSARWLTAVTREDQVVLRTNSATAQLAAAEHGVGALLLPRAIARVTSLVEVKLSPALRARLPAFAVQELHLVGHRALRQVPRIAAVWEFLVQTFEEAARRPSVREDPLGLRRGQRRH